MPGFTPQKSEILLNMERSVMGSSARRTMMSGEMPRPWSSFTECWVGFDLCSPEARRYGTSVTWI